MLAAVYLLSLALAGIAAVTVLLPNAPVMVRLAGGFIAGIVVAVWVTYVIALGFSPLTDESLLVGIFVSIVVSVGVLVALVPRLRLADFRLRPLEIALIGLALIFSFWLMDQRLSVNDDAPGNPVVVSANTWGDTALHVSLARSFSQGDNYPTEYPFYANEPIRYHFGYDFFAGALEKGGFNVPMAFNLPGALGFAAMMMLLFALARLLFAGHGGGTKDPGSLRNFGVWTGLVAVVLLLTNSSFAFVRYFEQYDTIPEALKPTHWFEEHYQYLAVGPYTSDIITIFNTPNVYLTQTHLIVGMALVLFVAFGLVQPLREGVSLTRQRGALLGVLFGLSFWLNGVLYISAGVFFGVLLVVFAVLAAARHDDFTRQLWAKAKEAAWFIVPALGLAIPQAIWLNGGMGTEGNVQTQIGYLVCSSPDASCWSNGGMDLLNIGHWGDFAEYWWLNVGLAVPLMALAMIWGSNSDRKIFLAAMAVFVFGSMFQLSRDLGGHNHKIFNLWENLTNPFVAFALVGLWNVSSQRVQLGFATIDGRVVRAAAKFVVVPVVFVFLVLSGLLDFMTIKNDFKVEVFGDKRPTIEWIDENLPRDAVFLTAWGELYVAPNLAGRGVYLGYDPWAASAGYDAETRRQRTAEMYGAPDKVAACRLLLQEEIDYVQIGPQERASGRFPLDAALFERDFVAAGSVDEAGGPVTYYDVAASCGDSVSVAAAG
ncbi:MAG: hypothetical protein IIA90_03315 [Chloroflexi bacterium]|nr:hypothetical protein [Chloroflexota bacterium]